MRFVVFISGPSAFGRGSAALGIPHFFFIQIPEYPGITRNIPEFSGTRAGGTRDNRQAKATPPLLSKIIGIGFEGIDLMRLGVRFFRFPGFRLCLPDPK